jgi:hypothetical protein
MLNLYLQIEIKWTKGRDERKCGKLGREEDEKREQTRIEKEEGKKQ